MTDNIHGYSPHTPSLPAEGWLPDPSQSDLERYWDGARWTSRVRNRYTRIEVGVAPAPQPLPQAPRRGSGTRLLALTGTFVLVMLGLGWLGLLPSWVPYNDALTRAAPTGPEVDYPVYGSTDLVRYLASSMVAQEESIDVSYWVHAQDASNDDIWAALSEASTQNPHVFVSEYAQQVSLATAEVRPTYVYDRAEAERRREQTQAAVDAALVQTGASAAVTDADKAVLVHDYVTAQATYDDAAFEAIESMDPENITLQIAQSQEAYGILVDGTAVCTGYAQAFHLLADAAGLESVIVTGEARGGVYTGGHAWNRVRIDGVWKTIDPTWNDYDSVWSGRVYFLLDDGDALLSTRTAGDTWVVAAHRGNYFN